MLRLYLRLLELDILYINTRISLTATQASQGTGGSPGLSLKSTPSKANNIGPPQDRYSNQNQIKAQEARDTASKLAIEVMSRHHDASLVFVV